MYLRRTDTDPRLSRQEKRRLVTRWNRIGVYILSKLQILRSFWLPSFDDRDSFADRGGRAGSIMLKLKGKDAAIMVIPRPMVHGETRPARFSVGDIYARRLSLFGVRPTAARNKERHMSFTVTLLDFLKENERARPCLLRPFISTFRKVHFGCSNWSAWEWC